MRGRRVAFPAPNQSPAHVVDAGSVVAPRIVAHLELDRHHAGRREDPKGSGGGLRGRTAGTLHGSGPLAPGAHTCGPTGKRGRRIRHLPLLPAHLPQRRVDLVRGRFAEADDVSLFVDRRGDGQPAARRSKVGQYAILPQVCMRLGRGLTVAHHLSALVHGIGVGRATAQRSQVGHRPPLPHEHTGRQVRCIAFHEHSATRVDVAG